VAGVNSYLQVEGLTKSFGDLVLFSDLTFGIAEGQRVGLIARNGAGKSTLLGILAGIEGRDSGSVVFRRDLKVGYLAQTPHYDGNKTVRDVCCRHAEELRVTQILTQLKIADFDQPIGQLSGGQLKRVALADVLAHNPDLLMLDEPTNHLDLEMVEWLEGWLQRSTLSLLMVTHDRYFLNRVCSEIWELDRQGLQAYKGNYSHYLEKKQERTDALNAEITKANNLYRTELDWMRRMPQARGHKARYREEAFYELEKVAKQRVLTANVQLDMKGRYIGNKIFEADHLYKRFADRVILDDFNYVFARYEKMGIIGNNGTGKSTFVKLLLGLEQPDGGRIDVGETVRFGYYSQEGMTFDEQQKVIDVVTDIAESIDLGDGNRITAMQMLQRFLFTPEKQHSYVYRLSGGERRRLYLCTVLMHNPNFLILDEPTNDLDIVTLQILEDYLQHFKGCLITVSHDRYFMDKIVGHLLVFNGNGDIRDFPGNYTEYRGWLDARKQRQKQQDTPARNKGETQKKVRMNERRKLSFKERQELERLEQEIGQLEQEKKQLEAQLCGATIDVQEITRMSKRLPLLEEELDEKSMRWLELSEMEG